MLPVGTFSDEDARRVILRALRLLAIVTAVALPFAAISGAGLWKWLRLMAVVMARMDSGDADARARPMGRVLMGFFLTLGLMLLALYVSLKYLDGSVYALAAGLAMGVFALTIEGLRLVKAWTV